MKIGNIVLLYKKYKNYNFLCFCKNSNLSPLVYILAMALYLINKVRV